MYGITFEFEEHGDDTVRGNGNCGVENIHVQVWDIERQHGQQPVGSYERRLVQIPTPK
jgi:hypothetical protein